MQPISNLIQISGPIGTLCDGYAYHNRAFIKMLHKYKFNIRAISAEPGAKGIPMSEDPELISILTESRNKPEGQIMFSFCIPPMYNIVPGKINMAFTTWETDKLPGDWVQQINKLHAVFVPSDIVRQVFVESGVKVPVFVMPYPIDTDNLDKIEPVTVSAEIPRKVTFLYSGAYTPRKNLEDLLLAYCSVFDKVDDVLLVIKTWSPTNDSNSRMAIQQAISGLVSKISCERRPKISIITDQLEDNHARALIKGADICVSTSKGEGLDLFMLESMALGKLCVTTMSMGRMDYVFTNSANVVDTTVRPVIDSGTPFHNTKMNWDVPLYSSLTRELLAAYNSISHTTKPKKAQEVVREKYNAEKVIAQFNDKLKYIVEKHEQKARESIRPQLQAPPIPQVGRA